MSAFVEDSISEDESVMPGRVWWTHAVSLHPRVKIEDYDFRPLVNDREIDFIKNKGVESASNWRLAMGRLDRIRQSGSPIDAKIAQRLYDVVYSNPNRLAELERRIIERLGVKVRYGPVSVYYNKKSQSVTMTWICHTKGEDEAMALSMIAPPNDDVKRSIMRNWIRSNPDDAHRIYSRLKNQDIEVEPRWLEEED